MARIKYVQVIKVFEKQYLILNVWDSGLRTPVLNDQNNDLSFSLDGCVQGARLFTELEKAEYLSLGAGIGQIYEEL